MPWERGCNISKKDIIKEKSPVNEICINDKIKKSDVKSGVPYYFNVCPGCSLNLAAFWRDVHSMKDLIKYIEKG